MLKNKGLQMIVVAILVAATIIAWLMLGGEAPSNNKTIKDDNGANAKVRNSTLMREEAGKKVWEITVDEVEQIKSSGEAVLKGVKGKLYRPDGSVLEITAGGGKVKNDAKDFELTDDVVAVLSSGGRLNAKSIRYQQAEDIITASGSVRLEKEDILATADKAITNSAFAAMKLEGNAEVQKGGSYSE